MAEGDFNLATLWLPVAPETSKVGPAMEQAGKDAKGKFTSAVKGIGDNIHDDLARAGTRASEAFHGVGKRITDIFAKAGGDSGKALTDGFQRGTQDLDKIPAPLKGIAENASHAASSVQNLNGAFSSLKSGDVANSLDHVQKSMDGINNLTKRVGVDISDWAPDIAKSEGELGGASEKISGMVSGASDFASTFENMPGKIGKVAGAVSKLGGEVAIVVEGLKVAGPYIDALDQKIRNSSGFGRFIEDHSPSTWGQSLADLFGADKVRAWMGQHFGYNPDDPFGDRGPTGATDANGNPLFKSGTASPLGPPPPPQYPSNFVGPLPPGATRTGPPQMPAPDTSHSFYKDWYGASASAPAEPSPSSSGRSSGSTSGSGYSRPSFNPSVGSRADLHAAGSRIAYLYQVAQSLEGTPYSKELRNDCSGMVSQLAAAALGLPPPAAGQRFTTVNEGQWLMSHGFRPGVGPPGSLQIGWYDHGGGDAGHTAATLPGGEHAESGGSHGNFLVGPGAAGAENPEFEHHAYLPMDGNAPGGLGARPAGSKSDPLFVSSADGGSGGESNGPWEGQGQQLGQGLVNGIAEMFGVDGSVFKGFGSGKGILDFGALKLGGGLLNWGMQMGKARMASNGGGDTSGLPMGGDGISLPGLSMIPGVGNLMPGRGAAISANVAPTGDGSPGGNTTVNIHGDVNSGFNVTQHGVQGSGYQDWKEQYNANSTRTAPLTVPNAGGLPAG